MTSLRAAMTFNISTLVRGFLCFRHGVMHVVERHESVTLRQRLELLELLDDAYLETILLMTDVYTDKLKGALRTAQRELLHKEKMAALGGLVAGVAHEINTPVGVAITASSLLADRVDALRAKFDDKSLRRRDMRSFLDDAREASALTAANLRRAGELIASFKKVAVDQSSQERRRFAVVEYLENLLLSLRPELRRHPVTVEISGDAELTLVNDPGALAQVVTNLVMNSLTHAFVGDASGAIGIRVDPAPDGIELEVRDDGRGIAGEHLAKIFDPFFTTQRGRGGSGLGLHVVYNLVTQRMRGTIRCESAPGAGARFSLSLPHTSA